MQEHFPDHDGAVTTWFQQHGWPVTATNYDFDREIYAWRSESQTAPRTLSITRRILEDTPAPELGSVLDSLRVADALNAKPKAYTLVMQEQGHAIVRQLDKPPTREG